MQPPSGAPGRSSTVTALSGRVQGLKFMQRAAAINGGSPSPSSGTSTPVSKTATAARATPSHPASASASPAPSARAGPSTPLVSTPISASTPQRPGLTSKADEDDEQWVLPSASLPRASSSNQETEPLAPEHEQGWNAWMASVTSAGGGGAGGAGRRSFGAWGKKLRNSAEEGEEDGEPAMDVEDETGLVAASDEEEENDDGKRSRQAKRPKAEKKKGARDDPPVPLRKGFVKPGSAGLSDGPTSLRKRGSKANLASPSPVAESKPGKLEREHQQARKEAAKRKGDEMSRRLAKADIEGGAKGKKKRRKRNKGGKEEREMGSSDEEAEGGFEGFADL